MLPQQARILADGFELPDLLRIQDLGTIQNKTLLGNQHGFFGFIMQALITQARKRSRHRIPPAVCYSLACFPLFRKFVAQTEDNLRKKLQALFESMLDALPPDFYRDLMRFSRKSGTSPAQVISTALGLYGTTLMRPDSKERLRVFAVQYHTLVTKEAAERLTPEQRAQRASPGGRALAELWTPAQKQARASLGGYAAAQKLTPEQRRQRALAAVETRRRNREERERAQASPSKRSEGSTKRSRS
jgi:hypothetical protein